VRIERLVVSFCGETIEATMRIPVTCIVAFGLAAAMAAPSFAGSRKHADDRYPQERYVPADGDVIDWLFGGPRYYDQQMITTAAGLCAYHRVGPDGNAVNDVNDHYCGK
jgi:hypothetical protein